MCNSDCWCEHCCTLLRTRGYDEDPEKRGAAVLRRLEEQEEEEEEMEEVEDVLQYYLQKTANVENEAQQYLDAARDLEESISVQLSARRFEVSSHLCA